MLFMTSFRHCSHTDVLVFSGIQLLDDLRTTIYDPELIWQLINREEKWSFYTVFAVCNYSILVCISVKLSLWMNSSF